MTNEQIDKFMQPAYLDKVAIQINFKTRRSLQGIFINSADFNELKVKNMWRIVSESRIEEYKKTKDSGLARIFNGSEMVKLGVVAS
jgi:hypothetical protein